MPVAPPTQSTQDSPRLRWLQMLVVAILALGMHSPVDAAPDSIGTVGATYRVNIRACARLDCQVIGSANLGDAIEITGDLVNGFYPVRWYGAEGYVFGLYLNAQGKAPWFVEGDPACNQVALLFNIGIGQSPSDSIIETLIDYDVPATMFPMGWWALAYPEYLLKIEEAGFVIGTHGDQPLYLTSVPDEIIRQDIADSVTAIESVIGREIDQYFTPYAADIDERVRSTASTLGLLPVGWNVSGNDYGPDATEHSVYERVIANVYPGAVIELHLDGPVTEQSTALALPRIIDDLTVQGYQFTTVPDMVIPCEGARPIP